MPFQSDQDSACLFPLGCGCYDASFSTASGDLRSILFSVGRDLCSSRLRRVSLRYLLVRLARCLSDSKYTPGEEESVVVFSYHMQGRTRSPISWDAFLGPGLLISLDECVPAPAS